MSALTLYNTYLVEAHLIPALTGESYIGIPVGMFKALKQWRSQLPQGVFEVTGKGSYTQGVVNGLIGDCVEVKLWTPARKKEEV